MNSVENASPKKSKKVLAVIIVILIVAVSGIAVAYIYNQQTLASEENDSATDSSSTSDTTTDWSIVINGTSCVNMNKSDFETLAAACPLSYNGSRMYNGTALYNIITWAINNGVISSSDLASGYTITLISDNSSVTLNSTFVDSNTNIILANIANGTEFSSDSSSYPLYLTGSDLSSSQKVKGVIQILITPSTNSSTELVSVENISDLLENLV